MDRRGFLKSLAALPLAAPAIAKAAAARAEGMYIPGELCSSVSGFASVGEFAPVERMSGVSLAGAFQSRQTVMDELGGSWKAVQAQIDAERNAWAATAIGPDEHLTPDG